MITINNSVENFDLVIRDLETGTEALATLVKGILEGSVTMAAPETAATKVAIKKWFDTLRPSIAADVESKMMARFNDKATDVVYAALDAVI